MRGNNEYNLGEAIKSVLNEWQDNPKFLQVQIKSAWEDIMGKAILNYTSGMFISKGILFIKLTSDVLKNELLFNKSKVIELMNEKLKRTVIQDIQFR